MTERDKVTVEDITGIVHTDEPTDSVEEVRKLRGRTNERFIVDTAGTLIDMVTRNTYDYVSEVCPLLNDIDSENTHVKYLLSEHMVDLNNCKGKCSALEEENEQLKIRFNEEREKSLKFCRNIDTLTIENEQLKSEIEKLSYANEDLLSEKRNWQRMSDEYCKLSDENEYIKNTIQEAYETERTHIGKSVLKQLMEQIQ